MVIGVSPAVGRDVWRSLSGLTVPEVLSELLAGLEEEGCTGRVVRFSDTVDLGRIGLAAARLAGSGIGIGLQGKGTALIHRRDLAPLANLELYSVAPSVTPELYRLLGRERGPARQGRHPGPGPQPVLRRGHRGPVPHHGDRADGAGTGLGPARCPGRGAVPEGAAMSGASPGDNPPLCLPGGLPPEPPAPAIAGPAGTRLRRTPPRRPMRSVACPGGRSASSPWRPSAAARSACPTCASTRTRWQPRRWWPSSTATRSWRRTCAGLPS